jgi:hypothetical protein
MVFVVLLGAALKSCAFHKSKFEDFEYSQRKGICVRNSLTEVSHDRQGSDNVFMVKACIVKQTLFYLLLMRLFAERAVMVLLNMGQFFYYSLFFFC